MRLSQRILLSLATVGIVAGAAVAGGDLAGSSPPPRVATSGKLTLERTYQGALISDAFTSPTSDRNLQDTFEFNGDLDPSRAFVHATSGGLRVGAQPPASDTGFDGWFAVTLAAYPKTSIFHVTMTKPAGNIAGPGQEAEAVFAVQTASTKVTGLINFVEVTSDSLQGQTAYQVDYSWGHIRDAKTRVYWRTEPSATAPNTVEATVRTDGAHTLTVWLGSRQVFSSNSLNLNMEAPFQPYLEVQTLHTPYVATFHDFWVTSSSTITVNHLPSGTVTAMTAPDGTVLAHATADRKGTATLNLPPYAAEGTATLTVTKPGGSQHQLGPFAYAGGDEFQLAGT